MLAWTVVFSVWIALSSAAGGWVRIIPQPWDVAAQIWIDGGYLLRHLLQTLEEAFLGYIAGNAAALLLASTFILVPILERILTPLLVAIYCLPIMAAAPLAQALLPGRAAIAAISAQAVFFITLVYGLAGLRSAPPALADVVAGLGGGRWAEFVKVRIRSAVPALFVSLDSSARAALVGAVVAEFVGGERGMGVALLTSLQAFNIERTWSLAIVLTATTACVSALTGLARALVVADGRPITSSEIAYAIPGATRRGEWRGLGQFLAAAAMLLVAWWGGVVALPFDPFIAKTPIEVLTCLTTPDKALPCGAPILGDVGRTLANTLLGYAGGIIAAIGLALATALSRSALRAALSIASAAASVPLTATAPLVALAVGRGPACVVIIVAMITLFPTLIGVSEGLNAAPPSATELSRGFGAGALAILFKVRVPYAVPSMLAAARLMAPLALLSALVSEWLAIGDGLGYRMLLAVHEADYAMLWTAVVLATSIAGGLYASVGFVERLLVTRLFG